MVLQRTVGQNDIAAHSVLRTFTHLIVVALPAGISTAATIRVGNLLGANKSAHAHLAGKLSLLLFSLLEC